MEINLIPCQTLVRLSTQTFSDRCLKMYDCKNHTVHEVSPILQISSVGVHVF